MDDPKHTFIGVEGVNSTMIVLLQLRLNMHMLLNTGRLENVVYDLSYSPDFLFLELPGHDLNAYRSSIIYLRVI